MTLSVAVITSTIARPELRQACASVAAQTYPATHYVFVNGPQHRWNAEIILAPFPAVKPTYLPVETGAGRPGMEGVFAAAPFLISEDIVMYLNDDDLYDPHHIQSLVTMIEQNNLDWAYSLRRFIDQDGGYVCDDDADSLGWFHCVYDENSYLVDANCYAVRAHLARKCAHIWFAQTPVTDRLYLRALMSNSTRSGCTGKSSVSYRLTESNAWHTNAGKSKLMNEQQRKNYPDGFPWRQPRTFVRTPA